MMSIPASRLFLLAWLPFLANSLVLNETKEFYEAVLHNAENPYDRRIRPFVGGKLREEATKKSDVWSALEKELEVKIFLRVLSLRSVSELTMDYNIELYFREFWQDPRLSFDPAMYKNASHISLHESIAWELWTPDTYLPSALKSTNPNSRSVTHRSLIRVEPDGHVLHSRRISVKAECPMDLSYYPFDSQVCLLSIESYGHSVTEVVYKWRKLNPVNMDPTLELPEYQVRGVKIQERNISMLTGTYTRLECCFFFKRNAGFYFVQIFLPATAIVVTSWLLLYMERTSRFSDMINVILAITLLYYSYITAMPRVSYIKAMDVYLGSAFVFVFISLLKLYALKLKKCRIRASQAGNDTISVTKSRRQMSTDVQAQILRDNFPRYSNSRRVTVCSEIRVCVEGPVGRRPSVLQQVQKRSSIWLRTFCSVAGSLGLFPVAFLCFTIVYFAFFLFQTSDNGEHKCHGSG